MGPTRSRSIYCNEHRGCDKPAWSPDGRRIAFSVVENESGVIGPGAVGIDVLDLDTGAVTPVIRLERPLLADVPSWSPDGTKLMIGVDRMDDVANETGAAVAIVPASGGEPTYLTDFSLFGYQPDWSPTGDRIVFSVQVREAMASLPADDTWDLWTVAPDGTDSPADDTRTGR